MTMVPVAVVCPFIHSEFGMVGTAAQSRLVGKEALARMTDAPVAYGLQSIPNGKIAQARGIGGEAKVCGVVEIPVGVAGIKGVIGASLVAEDVPLLPSVRFLREVQAVVDLQQGVLRLSKFDGQVIL